MVSYREEGDTGLFNTLVPKVNKLLTGSTEPFEPSTKKVSKHLYFESWTKIFNKVKIDLNN